MEHRGPIDGISSFVALGDSFTEGLNDPLPGGGYRGWADRFADMLSIHQPGLRYANLAVRGKLLREVAAEQVPRAIEMAPDLVSLAAGGNDLLRPGSDPDSLAETLDASVASLRAAGCRVLLLSGFDPCAFPVIRLLRGKAAVYNMHMRTIASTRQCDVVGLPADGDWREPLPQAPGPAGSAVAVAAAGATAVGVAATRAQVRLASVRMLSSAGLAWAGARRQDARWAKDYAMPWLRRMLRGQSPGDGVPPKRPDLLPVRALAGLPGLSGLSGADAP